MERLYSSHEVLHADRLAIDSFSIPSLSLMEQAAIAAYEEVIAFAGDGCEVCVVAGSGNNGADGLALARLLSTMSSCRVSILHIAGHESAGHRVQRLACEALGIPVVDSMPDDGIIIDAYLGAGISGSLRAEARAIIGKMNASHAALISLDVPSGIADDAFNPCADADLTVVFGPLKRPLYAPGMRSHCGRIVNRKLSYPQASLPESKVCLLDESGYRKLALEPDSYKHSRGRVAIIGGSPAYRGAVRLAAKAAFHAGAGMVTVFTDSAILDMVSLDCPAGAMVRPFAAFPSLASSFDSILIGPGLGRGEEALALAQAVSRLHLRRLVVDADAIGLISHSEAESVVLTPHVGEFRRLDSREPAGPEDFYAKLIETAARLGATIVYKAENVYVARHDGIDIVCGMNPSLGVAGSGDVLAGIIVALREGESVSNAVLLHQMAGRALASQKGFYTADELIEEAGRLR